MRDKTSKNRKLTKPEIALKPILAKLPPAKEATKLLALCCAIGFLGTAVFESAKSQDLLGRPNASLLEKDKLNSLSVEEKGQLANFVTSYSKTLEEVADGIDNTSFLEKDIIKQAASFINAEDFIEKKSTSSIVVDVIDLLYGDKLILIKDSLSVMQGDCSVSEFNSAKEGFIENARTLQLRLSTDKRKL